MQVFCAFQLFFLKITRYTEALFYINDNDDKKE